MEEYKEIPGTIYEISILGNIRNKDTGRVLKPWNRGKYRAVNLGLRNPFYIHKLMAFTYLEPVEGCDIDHINRDKHDNRLCNLRIISKSENRCNIPCLPSNKLQEKNISKKGDSYSVRIFRNGEYAFMKSFASLSEAIEARNNFIASNY